MPEALKHLFSAVVIKEMGAQLSIHDVNFDEDGFVEQATKNLASLELKQRSDQICSALHTHLPNDFAKAGPILLNSLAPVTLNQNTDSICQQGISGWPIMPLNTYVGLYGLAHFDLSMQLLKEMTKRFSSEFGIRYFLNSEPEKTLQTMLTWAQDDNYHVRRLASEGSRPRLPWAMQLPRFIADPKPIIALLCVLKDDPEEYVRRSVANSLNDIAKDHPELVADIASEWLKGASKYREKLVKHACRTLLKQGNQKALAAFGFAPVAIEDARLSVNKKVLSMGEGITFSLTLSAPTGTQARKLMIDYVIHHQKANGKTSPKVFKWKTITLQPNEAVALSKCHQFKPITTRVYHSGEHAIEVLVNGLAVAKVAFELSI